MSLIKIERMHYSQTGEYLPVEGELYVNPDEISSVSSDTMVYGGKEWSFRQHRKSN